MNDAARALGDILSAIPETAPACPRCDGPMRLLARRAKDIVGLVGVTKFSRGYYECRRCGAHTIPKDEVVGVSRTSFMPSVRAAVATLASEAPFEWASRVLDELTDVHISGKEVQRIAENAGFCIENGFQSVRNAILGGEDPPGNETAKKVEVMTIEMDGTGVPMVRRDIAGRKGKQKDGSSKTREAKIGCVFTQSAIDFGSKPVRDSGSTSYFGFIEDCHDFGERAYANAVMRGINAARQVVIIGDGAKWIWSIADEQFPQATQILDLYHAKEHVNDIAKLLRPACHKCLADRWCALLEDGGAEILAKQIRGFPATGGVSEQAETAAGYFKENAARMRYPEYKAKGYFVGSGVVEAACKSIVGQRFKQSGMFWSLDGANAMLALRCDDLSQGASVRYAIAA
jgi:hypothetical protein